MINLICIWGATQWAAYDLAFQEALGPPWMTVLGLPVYPPWQFFFWWLAFGSEASGVFDQAAVLAAFGGIVSGGLALGGAAQRTGQIKTIPAYPPHSVKIRSRYGIGWVRTAA